MKRSPIIEMTALLDVIMILMFLVLTNASQSVEDLKQGYKSSEVLEQSIGELQSENVSLIRRLNSFTALENSCLIITLSVSRNEDKSRSVLLECEDAQNETLKLTWDNLQYVKNTLNAKISKLISGALSGRYQAVFMVFQYDRSVIYQTDYRLISGVIQSQKRENVYCAEYDIREKQNE